MYEVAIQPSLVEVKFAQNQLRGVAGFRSASVVLVLMYRNQVKTHQAEPTMA